MVFEAPLGFRFEPWTEKGSAYTILPEYIEQFSVEYIVEQFRQSFDLCEDAVRSKNLDFDARSNITLDSALGVHTVLKFGAPVRALYALHFNLKEAPTDFGLMEVPLQKSHDFIIPYVIVGPVEVLLSNPRQQYFKSRYFEVA
jgi:hypothetical protein